MSNVDYSLGKRPSAAIRYFAERTPIPHFYQAHLGERYSSTGKITVLPFIRPSGAVTVWLSSPGRVIVSVGRWVVGQVYGTSQHLTLFAARWSFPKMSNVGMSHVRSQMHLSNNQITH